MDETTVLTSYSSDKDFRVDSTLPPALLSIGGFQNGRLFDLRAGSNRVGRHQDNDVMLSYTGVSRFHCELRVDDGASVRLADLGSSNGTFVNKRRIDAPTLLNHGDTLHIGAVTLRFLAAGSSERHTYQTLRAEADTDALTGCFNKAYFGRVIDYETRRARAVRQPLALMIFDLDHFKQLNDRYGHAAGDYVLGTLARAVAARGVRQGDVFCRFGGEEFVVVMPSTAIDAAGVCARRLRRIVAETAFRYDCQELAVTVSAGLAAFRADMDASALLKAADEALYRAKQRGRDRVVVAA